MMRNLIALALCVLAISIVFICCKDSETCSKVRSGKFYYLSKSDGHKIEVVRNDKIQIERDLITGDILESKVEWFSECEYHLVFNGTRRSKIDSFSREQVEIPIQIEIVEVKEDFYVWKANSSIDDKTFNTRDTFYFDR